MAEQFEIECRINDIQPIPNTKKQLVSVHFKLGHREWDKAYRLEYDRPISLEEFQREIIRAGALPEDDDFLCFVKEQGDTPFTIKVDKPVRNQADSIPQPEDT